MNERDDLVTVLAAALRRSWNLKKNWEGIAVKVIAAVEEKGRLRFRPTGACTACGHVAERASAIDWSCGDLCCRCTRSGGCKVAA
jgi:hypothetical protein